MALDSLIASAEASIIGSVLIEPTIVGELMQTVHPEDFSNAELRRVYEAVRAVWLESGNIDAVTVCAAAGSDTQPVIARCMIETPSAASWTEYAAIVKDAARLRRMQASAMRIVSASTLRDAERAAEDLNRSAIARSGVQITSMTDGIERLYKELCAGNKPQYLKWGMPQLDYQLFAELGDFVIIAGYPSAGKTMLATQFAVGLGKEHRVGFFSLETSDKKLYARIAAQDGGIAFAPIKNYSLDKEQFGEMYRYLHRVRESRPKVDVIDAAGMTVEDIQAISTAKRYDVVFIDYLQILNGVGDAGSYERATAVSIALHTFARRTKTAVIALSQLSRPEKGAKRRPRLSDLRSSGQIEQDADVVMTLSLKDSDDRSGPRYLDVLKNKEGECGCVSLIFDTEHIRMLPEVKNYRPKPKDRRARYKNEEEDET